MYVRSSVVMSSVSDFRVYSVTPPWPCASYGTVQRQLEMEHDVPLDDVVVDERQNSQEAILKLEGQAQVTG